MCLVSGTGVLIKNTDDWTNNFSSGQGVVGTFAARTAGAHGNNLLVSTLQVRRMKKNTFNFMTSWTAGVGDTVVVYNYKC